VKPIRFFIATVLVALQIGCGSSEPSGPATSEQAYPSSPGAKDTAPPESGNPSNPDMYKQDGV
jgi:hypothetical protein